MAKKTMHITHTDKGWAVKREGSKADRVFPTQREAIDTARDIVRDKGSGQLVIHNRDGRIRTIDTYGMPPIQDPPGKKSVKIEKAIGKITRQRLDADPHPARD